MHLSNEHFSHALAVALTAHAPPSSLAPPAPPPPPEPLVVLLVDPAAPEVVEVVVVPPSEVLSVVSVVHAPRIATTADAAAQLLMFIIVSLLAIVYVKPRDASAPVRTRHPCSIHRPSTEPRVYLVFRSSESNCRPRG